jgi:hypothetical protein
LSLGGRQGPIATHPSLSRAELTSRNPLVTGLVERGYREQHR